jgi:hypothetical protein
MARDGDPHERSEDERRLFAEERRRVEDAATPRGDGGGDGDSADTAPDERAVREARRRLEPDDPG